jgi:hypothetical protein
LIGETHAPRIGSFGFVSLKRDRLTYNHAPQRGAGGVKGYSHETNKRHPDIGNSKKKLNKINISHIISNIIAI